LRRMHRRSLAGFAGHRGARQHCGTQAATLTRFPWRSVATALAMWAAVLGGRGSISMAAQLQAPSLEHDFGLARQQQNLRHAFTVFNVGRKKEDLRPSPSCSCVSATITPPAVAPGDGCSLEVSVQTGELRGRQEVTLRIFADDETTESLLFRVVFTVTPEFEVTPAEVRFSVKHANTGNAVVVVRPVAGKGVRVTSVESDSPFVQAAVSEAKGKHTGSRLVRVTVPPCAPQGRLTAVLRVKTTSARVPVLRIPVAVSVNGPFALSPNQVSFGMVYAPDGAVSTQTRQVTVRRKDGKAFMLSIGACGHQGVSARLAESGKRSVHHVIILLRLQVGTPRSTGFLETAIPLYADGTREPAILLPTLAYVRPRRSADSSSCCGKTAGAEGSRRSEPR